MQLLKTAAIAPLMLSLCATPTPAQDSAPEPASTVQTVQPAVTHSSTLWKKGANDVEGGYRIERDRDGLVLILTDDFKTKTAPDLKVALSPMAHDKVKSKTALKGSLVLGPLPSPMGSSSFRIPDTTDLSAYKSVVIHCEQYTKLWASAPLSAGEVIVSGDSWTRKTNKITGQWEIARTESGLVLRLGEKFKTKSAPDLKLVLSPNPISRAKNDNALRGGVVIAPLRSNKGAQEYAIPERVDLADFRSLLIHCEQYTKLWGGAPLNGA